MEKGNFLSALVLIVTALVMAVHTRNHPAVVKFRSAVMGLAKFGSGNNGYSQVEMKDFDEEVQPVGPTPPYPAEQRVVDLFQHHVNEQPEATAVTAIVDGKADSQEQEVIELTYRNLAALVKEAASAVTSAGAAPGSTALLLVRRSIAQVVAVYAVLQAGAGAIPVDVDAPFSRKEVVAKDSDAFLIVGVLTEGSCEQLAKQCSLPLLQLPADGGLGRLQITQDVTAPLAEQAAVQRHPQQGDLAILLYTSGTTGTPKGIIYDHEHLMHGTWFFSELCSMSNSSVGLLKSPYIWAVVEWELFPALMRGGRLVVSSAGAHKSPPLLAKAIKEHLVNVLMITPQVLDLVLDVHEAQGGSQPLRGLQQIVTVGEPLFSVLANRVVQTRGIVAALHNIYGASESSCTTYTVPARGMDLAAFPRNVPAGRPQPHSAVYVMRVESIDASAELIGKASDSKLGSHAKVRLVPVAQDESGEICFGGVLAAGYWKLKELTAEKWVQTEFGRLYRTGDRGQWRHGVLEVIGRIDRQVKVRGVRVEPEEVEAVLRKFGNGKGSDTEAASSLSRVAVVTSKEPVELVAFVCPRSAADQVAAEELRKHCLAHLPDGYVPKFFVIEKNIPQLPNGKTDISALQQQASEIAQKDQHTVVDSLGQMKTVSSMALAESRVIHRCYAYWMAGVVLDHYCQCAMEDGELVQYCSALLHPSMKHWVETFVRSIGNDQAMFGYIMLGAYKESGDNNGKVKLGPEDLYMLIVNMAMVMPIPQILNVVCGTWAWSCYRPIFPEGLWSFEYMRNNFSTGVHRWYLLMVLEARAFMALCGRMGLSPRVQVVLVTLPVLLPSWVYGGREYALDICEGGWMWEPVEYLINWIWMTYPGGPRCALYWNWMHWYVTYYVWCFHYLRPVVKWGIARIPLTATGGMIAGCLSIFIGICMAMFHYPNQSLESGEASQWAWLEISTSVAQPSLLAVGMAFLPLDLSYWGNSTLGTYIFHYYFMGRATQAIKGFAVATAWDPTGLSTLTLILSVVLFVNTVIGPLGHKLLVHLRTFLVKTIAAFVIRSSSLARGLTK